MTDSKKPRTEAQKFTTDIMWVAVSQILTSSFGLITLPSLTKNYSSELYGVWSQVNVTVGLLTPFLMLQLSAAVIRFLSAEKNLLNRRNAVGSMLWLILAISSTVFLLSLVYQRKIAIILFSDPDYSNFVPLIALWAATIALFEFLISYLRSKGRNKKVAILRFTSAAGTMFAIVIVAIAGFGLECIVACIITIEVVISIIVLIGVIREIGFPVPKIAGLRGYLSYSIPLIPFGVLIWVINASDRYLITHLLDVSQTGIYTASYTMGSLISLFYFPISYVLFPKLSQLWEQRQMNMVSNYMEYSTKLFLLLAIPATAGLFLLSQPLLRDLAGPDYMAGNELVLLVASSAIMLGIYQINVFIIHLIKQTKWMPVVILISAFLNFGLNIWLIPEIGLIAAAFSTIVSYFVLAVIVIVWARKAITYNLDFLFIGKIIFATIIMSFVLLFMPVESPLDVIMAVVVGFLIYGIMLLVLHVFSKQDISILKEVTKGFWYVDNKR